MPFVIFRRGSFTVHVGDHLRFGIICGPIWGSFPVGGSFAVGDHLRCCTVFQYRTSVQVSLQKHAIILKKKRSGITIGHGFRVPSVFRNRKFGNHSNQVSPSIEGLFFIVTFLQMKYYRSFWTLKA